MRPLTRATLRGVWGTLLLPVEADQTIDWGRLESDLRHLLGAGLDGLYAHGTAGEFFTLDEVEFGRVNRLLADRCEAQGIPFQIGASHMSAQTCRQRVRRATELRPGAIQVTLPDWVPLSDEEVVGAVAGLAAAARPVPIVLYNPPHAKTIVPPELYGRLARDVPELIGVKVLGGDDAWYRAVRGAAPDLALFVAGTTLASGLRRGAAGSYSNIACLSPQGASAWYRTMGADPDAAAELESRIVTFFERQVKPLQRAGYGSPALDKFLAAVGGWGSAGVRVRWPYRSVPEEAVLAARAEARRLLPELVAPST
ncbi:MAG: dihydrodipicolinate synthase family protein [Candidatus Dormibacteraceae bacterium]